MFEVWNEPNLNGQRHPYDPPPHPGWRGGGDWWGTGAEYMELYASAAHAVKAASRRVRVGGPATTGPARWVDEFQNYCAAHAVPLDFISTHACEDDRSLSRSRLMCAISLTRNALPF